MSVDLLTITFGVLCLVAHVYWMFRMKDSEFLGRINRSLSSFPTNLTGGMVAAVWIVFIPPFVLGIAVAHMATYVSLMAAIILAVVILLLQLFAVPKRQAAKA